MPNGEITKGAEVFATLLKSITDFIKRSQRILFPGLAVALFLGYRHGINAFQGLAEVPSLFLSFLIGTLVYYIYRSLVHPCAQFLQRRSAIGIPQHQFHEQVCEERAWDGVIKTSTKFSQACLGVFQNTRLKAGQQADTYAYNSGSHLLYMTATLGLLFIVHDSYVVLRLPHIQHVNGGAAKGAVTPESDEGSGHIAPSAPIKESPPFEDSSPSRELEETEETSEDGPQLRRPTFNDFAGWTALFIVGFSGGLSFDRNADYREALALYTNREDYLDIVSLAAMSWIEGSRKLDWRYRLKNFFMPWTLKSGKGESEEEKSK